MGWSQARPPPVDALEPQTGDHAVGWRGHAMQHPPEGWTFGSLLRWYRTNAGLTQEQLAERAGLSRRGIADLERGARRVPYAHTIERLATALGLSSTDHAALVEAVRRQGASSGASREPQPRTLPTSPDALEPGADPAARHNVPLRPTRFVGRQIERAQLDALIPSSPLVTLVGPGGVGKTRLALEVAADQVGRWLDGVWLVELAALSDGTLVSWSVGAVLGVQQWSGRELTADLVEWLRNKRLLLLLDNCEHVVEAAAQLITHQDQVDVLAGAVTIPER